LMNCATPSFTPCHVLVSLETSFNTSAYADITCISSVYHLYILYLDQKITQKSWISTAQMLAKFSRSTQLGWRFFSLPGLQSYRQWQWPGHGAVIVPSHLSPWSKLCRLAT
jgi:hypothetical protein